METGSSLFPVKKRTTSPDYHNKRMRPVPDIGEDVCNPEKNVASGRIFASRNIKSGAALIFMSNYSYICYKVSIHEICFKGTCASP